MKDLSEPFSRTWNYTNQRVVYQYRIFHQIVDNKENILKQVQICYIDNKVYEDIIEICKIKKKTEEKERNEQALKAEKEREEQKLIKEAKDSAQRIKESEQI